MEAPQVITVFMALGVLFIVFLVCREITCWYFKFTELSSKLDAVNKNLEAIRVALEPRPAVIPPPMQPGPVLPSSMKGISPPLVKPGNTP